MERQFDETKSAIKREKVRKGEKGRRERQRKKLERDGRRVKTSCFILTQERGDMSMQCR